MRELQLYYKNLPKNWGVLKRESFNISDVKLKEYVDKFEKLPKKHISIYVQNGCGLLVNSLFDKRDISGIDFKAYFDNVFNKETSFNIKESSEIVVIYNIGFEKALNLGFSKQLLLGLLEELKNNNQIVLLSSYLPYNEFYKKYDIDIVNHITISEKKQEKIF